MYLDLMLTGSAMPSPKKWIVIALMCLAATWCRSMAQQQGQVTVLDTTSEHWKFLCTATADPTTDNEFYFDLPPLDAAQTEDPDFSDSEHCPNGCEWAWDMKNGIIHGLTVQLPAEAAGAGTVATVDGWPIIDNIDLKVGGSLFWDGQEKGFVKFATKHWQISLQFFGFSQSQGTIEVLTMEGKQVFRQALQTDSMREISISLSPGIYLFVVQLEGITKVKKLTVPY